MGSISVTLCDVLEKDEKFDAYKTIYQNCKRAGIDPPEEVEAYFDADHFKLEGARPFFESWSKKGRECKIEDWENEMEEAWEIDISQISPLQSKIILVVNYD